jgi:formate dehydrogenase subunit gamma
VSSQEKLAQIVSEHEGREGPLLPILIDTQKELGCIDEDAEAFIAAALNITRAEVHGVVSFYHDFLSQPDPRPEVQICRAEACKARGIEALMAGATKAAGGRVKLTDVYCLGLCSAGPSARVGDTLYARLDGPALTKLIEKA